MFHTRADLKAAEENLPRRQSRQFSGPIERFSVQELAVQNSGHATPAFLKRSRTAMIRYSLRRREMWAHKNCSAYVISFAIVAGWLAPLGIYAAGSTTPCARIL